MKKFIGQIPSELLAARIYDKRTILNNGLKAKTNFNYTKKQLDRLLLNDTEFSVSDLTEDE